MSRQLIEQVIAEQNYPVLTESNYDDFVSQQENCMVFFAEDPKRYPESNDVVIVLPELEKTFSGLITVATVAPEDENVLSKRYGFNLWPTLVFLKDGKFVDMINRMQDWSEYMSSIPQILEKQPSRAPSIGIAVEAR